MTVRTIVARAVNEYIKSMIQCRNEGTVKKNAHALWIKYETVDRAMRLELVEMQRALGKGKTDLCQEIIVDLMNIRNIGAEFEDIEKRFMGALSKLMEDIKQKKRTPASAEEIAKTLGRDILPKMYDAFGNLIISATKTERIAKKAA